MILAIASGKGGTGKTCVTASLAAVWPRPVLCVDMDVEEPNLGLFLKEDFLETEAITLEVPRIDKAACTLCKACVELCQFKAIAAFGKYLHVTPEMCHSCGGCMAICPAGAIQSDSRLLGAIEYSPSMLTGRLRIGESMSPPLIIALRQRMVAYSGGRDILIDSPPGVSCPVMNAAQDAQAVILVAEPTPFGFYDFQLACQAFLPTRKPLGVVINKSTLGDGRMKQFCLEKKLPILAEIPFSRALAEHYAQGGLFAELPACRPTFEALAERLIAGDWHA